MADHEEDGVDEREVVPCLFRSDFVRSTVSGGGPQDGDPFDDP